MKDTKYTIWHKYKIALAHIPKTGVTSFAYCVLKDLYQDNPELINLVKKDTISFTNADSPETREKLKKLLLAEGIPNTPVLIHPMLYILNKNFPENNSHSTVVPSNYYKFAFVRNPYIRFFASYHYFKWHFKNHYNYGEQLRLIFKNPLPFQETVKKHGNLLYKINEHFWPMKVFINKLNDDTNIFRFEDYSNTMKKIFKNHGINWDNTHKNKIIKEDYKNKYDEYAKRFIRFYFAWDIKNLGYNFNGHDNRKLDVKKLKSLF